MKKTISLLALILICATSLQLTYAEENLQDDLIESGAKNILIDNLRRIFAEAKGQTVSPMRHGLSQEFFQTNTPCVTELA